MRRKNDVIDADLSVLLITATRHVSGFKIRFMSKRPTLGNYLKSFVEVTRVDDVCHCQYET